MRIGVIVTWICIGLGFFADSTFFLVGMAVFLSVAIMWTIMAVQDGVSFQTFLIVWGIPIVMIVFLGFAVMWLPELPREKTDEK